MHLKNRNRITSAAAVFLAGAFLLTYGAANEHLPHTLAGATTTLVGVISGSMILVHRWVTATSAERRALLDARLRADDERARYLAAQYALAKEKDRLRRDAIAASRRVDVELQRQRDVLRQQFADQRTDLICETIESTYRMIKDGKLLDPPARSAARGRAVIPFPEQPADRERTRGRGRDLSS